MPEGATERRQAPSRHTRTSKISEQIARQIMADIHHRALPPGATLPAETVMVERFGVGRASLREALRILEINGLITIKSGPGGGPIVAAPDSQDFGQMSTLHYHSHGATFRELLDSRVALHAMLAGRAAAQPGPEPGRMVRQAREQAAQYLEEDDAVYADAHAEFHRAVFAAAGNPILALMANSLQDIWYVRVTTVMFPWDMRPAVDAIHEEITRAIERHSPRTAERVMRTHLEYYQRYCEERYPARLDDIVDWS
jgi:GntR family transcriptional regulator, transcriptional repressor for pyruvate dehydrogenase complex